MFKESIQTFDTLKETGVTSNINERVKYTAVTGLGSISTGNSSLNGSGAQSVVFSSTGGNGSLLKRITIKALHSTTVRGMVRLFVLPPSGTNSFLLTELEVPIVTQSNIDESFCLRLSVNYYLQNGYQLKASTENSDHFTIFVEGLDFDYI